MNLRAYYIMQACVRIWKLPEVLLFQVPGTGSHFHQKKFKAPLPEILPQAHELKIVVFNRSDFAWAEQWGAQVSEDCKLYLQPEWSRAEQVTPLIIDYIKANPRWQLSLQVHKYINVP